MRSSILGKLLLEDGPPFKSELLSVKNKVIFSSIGEDSVPIENIPFPSLSTIGDRNVSLAVNKQAGGEFRVNSYTSNSQAFADAVNKQEGGEFRVNSYTSNSQAFADIDALIDGSFVVVWTSDGQDGSGSGVYFQRYTADGLPVGVETAVNTYSTSNQQDPSVSRLNGGGFVIVWTSQFGQDSSGDGVFAQIFDAGGEKIGSETLVNSEVNADQAKACVKSLSGGGFVVTWQSDNQDNSGFGIYFQIFDADGTKIGPEVRANTYTNSNQQEASICPLLNGEFVIVWTSQYGQDGAGDGVFGQRFDAGGQPVGVEFQVNTTTIADQAAPATACLTDGTFVVAWHSDGQDGSGFGIYYQMFTSGGVKLGPETRVNTYVNSNQQNPNVCALLNGGFVVTWTSQFGQDGGGDGVYAQKFDASGARIGEEFLVNSTTSADQSMPALSTSGTNGVVFVWQSADQDGSGFGVYAKTFQVSDASGVDMPESRVNTYEQGEQYAPNLAQLSNGNYVVAWVSGNQDGDGSGVYAQIFNSAGQKVGGEFRVSESTVGNQSYRPVVTATDGGFAIAWSHYITSQPNIIQMRVFSNNGTALTGDVNVTTLSENASSPDIAGLSDGTYVVAFKGYRSGTAAVITQHYDAAGNALDGQVVIHNDPLQGYRNTPTIAALNNGKYLVAWSGYSSLPGWPPLLSLITDVLDFSKLEAGQVTLDPQPTDLRQLAGDVVDQFMALTDTRNITIGFDYDEASPVWLKIDDVRIRQVLYNLIGNACKFTHDGYVAVTLAVTDGRLRVEVRDSGPGLTQEQRVRLFTRFNQVDNSINRKYGGSGLGLSICHEIVKLMQGQIGVESEAGKGSTFWFEVPVVESEAPAPVAVMLDQRPVFLEDRKVLIVDDHPVNRELIRLLLKDYGLEIFEACDGAEAMEMCSTVRFDLVFMDIQMPVLDGITATRMLCERGGENQPGAIVALSAATQTKLLTDTRGHGFDHVLCKPIDLPQFYSTLHRCLEDTDGTPIVLAC